MKTTVLIALLMFGCGDALIPEATERWSLSVGTWEAPTCVGEMRATRAVDNFANATLTGTWTCGEGTGGDARMELLTDSRVFMDLETQPGFWSHVRARVIDEHGPVIAGDIMWDGFPIPIFAFK